MKETNEGEASTLQIKCERSLGMPLSEQYSSVGVLPSNTDLVKGIAEERQCIVLSQVAIYGQKFKFSQFLLAVVLVLLARPPCLTPSCARRWTTCSNA